MSNALAPAFDFCQFQRFVNNLGGSPEFRAHNVEPEFVDDRLSQYGFQCWSDIVPHLDNWRSFVRNDYPPFPGVYAITTVAHIGRTWDENVLGAQHLLYIGSAKNIDQRLKHPNHWLQRIVDRFKPDDTLLFVRVLLTKDYLWAEKSLIRTLRPWLNIHHRNG